MYQNGEFVVYCGGRKFTLHFNFLKGEYMYTIIDEDDDAYIIKKTDSGYEIDFTESLLMWNEEDVIGFTYFEGTERVVSVSIRCPRDIQNFLLSNFKVRRHWLDSTTI